VFQVGSLAGVLGAWDASSNACQVIGGVDCRILPSGRSARLAPIESFPEGAMDRALENVERQVKARMARVDHIIAATDVLNIDVVIIAPTFRPSLVVPEVIAAIVEAVMGVNFGLTTLEGHPRPTSGLQVNDSAASGFGLEQPTASRIRLRV